MVALLLAGCHSVKDSEALARFEFNEPHMGTLFSITLYARDAGEANAAAEAAFAEVAKLDRMMTDYDPSSELMQLCRRPVGEPTRVSPELFELLAESLRVARETDGAFDITVGPFVRAWRAARKSKILPSAGELARLRANVGYEHVRLDAKTKTVTLLAPDMQLDLGGIAKGYAADRALEKMRRYGVTRALVAASGDIAIGDAPPGKAGWRVGIAALDGAAGELARTVLLANAGVSTSGDSEQNVEIGGVRYSHIIDPQTGLGMTNHIQTTIIGPNATITDGLDTPTAIMGVERGMKLINGQRGLAALFVVREGMKVETVVSKEFARRFGVGGDTVIIYR
ncbi:MAG TPA: FAD:protein FMN transferase [Verrucomicrobiae bacterium]|jgi:thiamine biosynthesis lipoprotein|nr:FAD:protein FMN transferase [Verrucomicrobiae bacterium]